ncbi:MAG: MHS family MFS transporter [Alphaproteobacteria bacterium]|nr:MHS family MFS transporter [Alphaproteobacteria bacterium]
MRTGNIQLGGNVLPHSYSVTLSTLRTPVLIVSLLGNVLEYFEYAIYGFLAPTLALHFFPDSNPTTALIQTFGVFAVGSLAKPIGALIFGYLGDTRGRRATLRYTMIGIAFPTFAVGTLPGYEAWGLSAALALVLCRMLQGIFMAGESDGVRIYVFEHLGNKNPCLISALISCSAYLGIALASLVASYIPAEGEAWRFAFWGSGTFGIIIYFLRRYLVETPPFLQARLSPSQTIRGKQIFKKHWPSLIRTIMLCGAVGGLYHFYLVFQATYLTKILMLIPEAASKAYSFWLIVLYVCALPFAGWIADRGGAALIGISGGLLTLILAVFQLLILLKGLVFLPLIALTTLSMVFFVAPGYFFLTQQYDVSIRFRCLSFGHALGSMLFSGTTPVVSLFLWQATSLSYAPFLYFIFLIIMGLGSFIWGTHDKAYTKLLTPSFAPVALNTQNATSSALSKVA